MYVLEVHGVWMDASRDTGTGTGTLERRGTAKENMVVCVLSIVLMLVLYPMFVDYAIWSAWLQGHKIRRDAGRRNKRV